MKTALYSRVSTLEQKKEGYSIHAQKGRLEAYAKAKGLSNVQHYSDPAFSGASLDRPEMQRLMKDIDRGKVQTVIVYKLDRLSRSQKDTLTLVQDIFNKNNVNFVSLEENIDTSTPVGITMIGIMAAFAELERSTFAQRTSMGREERAKQGYYHGGGNYDPLGYEYTDGLLHIKEEEVPIVKDAFYWYTNGCSMSETSKRLRKKYPERIKSYTIVKDMIKNPLYVGRVRFNGKEFEGKHNPIIDEETFRKAQKVRKTRSIGSTTSNKRKGLLLGKIYCAHCGARYYRDVSGTKKYRYTKYKCRSKDYRRANISMVKDRNCKNKNWDEDKLDQVVIDQLQRFEFDEEYESDKTEQIKQKERKIDKLYKQIERTKELFVMGIIEAEEVKEKTANLKTQISDLKLDIKELEETEREEKINLLRNFDWKKEEKETKLKLIDEVVDRVEVDNDAVYVRLNF